MPTYNCTCNACLNKTKPPIGLKPERIWREARAAELLSAIQRYSYAGIYNDKLISWVDELSRFYHDFGQEL